MKRYAWIGALILVMLTAGAASASDFMDTWVTFVFADDNINAGAEDRSPGAGFQKVNDELFFENIQSEKRGQETLTQLVLYKEMPSYFPHLNVEAALVIEFENYVNEDTYKNETQIGDDGSYLKLNYFFSADTYSGDHISITAFPMDSNRFLLGYTYDITWGGEDIFPNNSGQVPGVRLRGQWGTDSGYEGYAFLGAKTARLLNEEINERDTYYGFLAGFGQQFFSVMRWEANGGMFQRGVFPPQGQDSEIGGKIVEAYGASTRIGFAQGKEIGDSIEFRLYKNNPEAGQKMMEPRVYLPGTSWETYLEATYITQNLLEWDEVDTTVLQPATAGALNAKLQINKLRLHADMIYQDLSFILFNIPGLAPYKAFPDDTTVRPEWFAAGGVDYFFETPHLTPGLIVGLKQPATFESGDNVITVFRDEDDWETLPRGEDAFNILSAKGTLKWDVAPIFTIAAEVKYTVDKNRTRYEKSDSESGRERVFEEDNVTNRLGFALLMQARF